MPTASPEERGASWLVPTEMRGDVAGSWGWAGPALPVSSRHAGPSLLYARLLLWGQVSLQVSPKNPSANGEVLGDAAAEKGCGD